MPHADFIHLRVHSAYSLSTGAIKVKELVKLCQRHRMPAVAVADTGNLFGALEFATAAAEAGADRPGGGAGHAGAAGAEPGGLRQSLEAREQGLPRERRRGGAASRSRG